MTGPNVIPHRPIHRHQSLVLNPIIIYISPSLSFALCLASSEVLGLFKVALRPPATLFGFLSPLPELDFEVGTSPPLSMFERTSLECCLASSEVSESLSARFQWMVHESERTGVVEVGLVASDNVSRVRHDVAC